MNITKALKEKNKKIKEINEYAQKMSLYNSIEEGTTRPYSATEMLENYKKAVSELIELKTKIHQANTKVYHKIFRLSELKSMVNNIRSLNCTEGKTPPSRWSSEDRPVMVSEISLIDRDNLVKELEKEIEQIHDELDYHNSTTEI